MKNYVCVGYGKRITADKAEKFFKKDKQLSVIIPTLNEEENVEEAVEGIRKAVLKTKFKKSFEVIIVDDNSSDRTPQIIDKLAKQTGVIALHRYHKKEIFTAYLDGIKVSNGEYVLTTGADLSQPPSKIAEMVPLLDNFNMIIGSRYVKGGGMKASFSRKWGSYGLNKICRFISGLGFKDLTGNFHLMKRSDFDKIDFRYRDYAFGEFDIEWIYRALKNGLSIKETPFTYKDRIKGTSKMNNMFLTSIKYINMSLRIRLEGKL